jgi:hypothetical protein
MSVRVALLPPDERPVHLRLPSLLADVVGATLLLPPTDALPACREPGDTAALAAWLHEVAGDVDAVLVSLEALCHGGMIPSRLTTEDTTTVVGRLATLHHLRADHPTLHLDASGFVTRLPDLDDATEEPSSWARYGRALAAYGRALDHADRSDSTEEDVRELAAARDAVPEAVRRDVLRRRARNHAVLLAALDLAVDGTLDGLVLSSDDTAPVGLPAREGRWLDAWLAALGETVPVARYPGADEVASVRLARVLTADRDPLRVALVEDPALDRLGAYEGRSIRATTHGQVASLGAHLVDHPDDAEVVLVVAPPEPDGDWALAPPPDDPARDARTVAVADRIAELVEAGHDVAVADCVHPNGGSPVLVDRLRERGVLDRLLAYAGWNTAGNTLGSALAHAALGHAATGTGRRGPGTAHERLLVHRLLEDVGYQSLERTALCQQRSDAQLPSEPTHDELPEVTAQLTERLAARLATFRPLGERWQLTDAGVQLPWSRTFECDLDLEPRRG